LIKWISLSNLALALARDDPFWGAMHSAAVPGAKDAYGQMVIESACASVANAARSGVVPTHGTTGPPYKYQRIERWLTPASDIDAYQNRVTAVIDNRRMTFEQAEIGETEARAWLNENAGEATAESIGEAITTETRGKPGPKAKQAAFEQFKQRCKDGELFSNQQMMDAFGIKERTASRWRKRACGG
jgi:hypothetical protein